MRSALSIASPVGQLCLVAEGGFLTELSWGAGEPGVPSPLLIEAQAQIDAYFAGKLKRFDLPMRAATNLLQHAVLEGLHAIAYGETRTYGDLAKSLGEGVSAQAVGQALGANPLPILIPCHRVLAVGNLGGYSGGGGIETKVALLRLEAAAGLLI